MSEKEDMDEDLKEMWEKAVEKFCKANKLERKELKQNITPKDVIERLDDNKKREEKAAAKYATAKDILGKTMACLEIIGGIAMQGVSVVCLFALHCVWYC